ncbi:MAG: hypothetical protein Q8S00_13045 [Deltaproteobacteria bacterium]|nr:hypothetical protein [Deltaproteobacteria bacterium]
MIESAADITFTEPSGPRLPKKKKAEPEKATPKPEERKSVK